MHVCSKACRIGFKALEKRHNLILDQRKGLSGMVQVTCEDNIFSPQGATAQSLDEDDHGLWCGTFLEWQMAEIQAARTLRDLGSLNHASPMVPDVQIRGQARNQYFLERVAEKPRPWANGAET